MIKNLKESDVKVKLIDEILDVSCSLADGNEFKLHFNLFKTIYVSESNWTVSPSKLEIKLKKTDRKRWQSLEVLPDKSGKRSVSFVGFVQSNANKKANLALNRVNTSLEENYGFGNSLFSPKYDWYQTNTNVNITIHIPNLNEEDVKVEFTENTLFWCCKLSDGNVYNVKLSLFKPIIVGSSNWHLTVSKLEISLKKRDAGRWTNLEAVSQMIKSSNLVSNNKVSTTFISEASPEPSCSGLDNSNDNNIDLIEDNIDCGANCSDVLANHEKGFNYTLVSLEPTDIVHDNHKNHKDLENLDKIVTEFKEKEKQIEEKEGNTSDGTVDELIREIYEKGGEEVRRAMNKRFNESGAVLSLEEMKNDSEVKNEIDLNNEEVCELTPNLD
jgi:hypothetical protein